MSNETIETDTAASTENEAAAASSTSSQGEAPTGSDLASAKKGQALKSEKLSSESATAEPSQTGAQTSGIAETTSEPSHEMVSSSSSTNASPSRSKVDVLPLLPEATVTGAVPGQQYVVLLQSDASGKLVGTLPPGFTATTRPSITLKRGASKALTTAGSSSQSSISKPMTITGITKPAGVTIPIPRLAATAASQAVKTVTVPAVVTTSGIVPGVTQIFLPAVSSTTTATPSATAVAAVTAAIKPSVKVTTVVKTKPVANGSNAVNGTRTVAVKTGVLSNGVVKKIPTKTGTTVVQTKTGVKTSGSHPVMAKVLNKPLTAYDKALQQKRALAESVTKFRKIEKAMLAGRPDQTTPFTYAEVFHHAAVSFSKMASLTTHISLESQTSMEQRRWTPELINKFVNSINTFATSLKEVGDELKKKHEQNLVVNLKRKAETELANQKKVAASGVNMQDGIGSKATPNVMNSFLASVSNSAAKPVDAETDSVKLRLSISTDNALSSINTVETATDAVAIKNIEGPTASKESDVKPAQTTPSAAEDLLTDKSVAHSTSGSQAASSGISTEDANAKPISAADVDTDATGTENSRQVGTVTTDGRVGDPMTDNGSSEAADIVQAGGSTESEQKEQDVEMEVPASMPAAAST